MKHERDRRDRKNAPTTEARSENRLVGNLGPVAIIFMVVAAAAPMSSVGATVPLSILIANGPAFPAMYVVAAVILALFAVGFVAMTPHIPRAGAFYSYVTHSMGSRSGLGAAYLALVTYTAVQIAVYAFLGLLLDELLVSHGGPNLGWFTWAIGLVIFVGFLGYRHLNLSSKVLGVVLVLEIVLCGAIAVVALFRGGPEGYSTAAFNLSDITAGSPGLGLMFAISGFIGFEATAIFRDEARQPERTIPRATYGALALIGIFYAFVAWAMVTTWGDSGVVARASDQSETMLPDTAAIVLGSTVGDIVQWVLLGSLFACILSFHNVLARYLFTMGNNGALHTTLGRTHPVHSSPYVSSLTQTASAVLLLTACGLFGLDPVAEIFAWFLGTATVGILVLMVLTSVAVLKFFRMNRVDTRRWNTKVAPTLGFIGLLLALAITASNFPVLMGSTILGIIASVILVVTFAAGFVRRGQVTTDEPIASPTEI